MTINTMAKDKVAELIDFISTMRQEPERTFWYIGRQDKAQEELKDTLLAESMRGKFTDGVWYPLDSERRDCCGAHEKDVETNPFALMAHCCSKEHVARLLVGMTEDEIQKEYDYMLEHVFESLTDDWDDLV